MASKNKVKLCHLIIDQQFGPIVSQLAKVMLSRGRLPLPVLIKHSNLSDDLARKSLFVLMQHHLISYFEIARVFHYIIEVDRVIDRLNLINITILAEKKFGYTGLEIANVFIVNGKLKLNDLKILLEGKEDLKGKVLEEKEVINTMKQMLVKRFVIPIDAEAMKSKIDVVLKEHEDVKEKLGILAKASDIKKELLKTQKSKTKSFKSQVTGFKGGISEPQSKKKNSRGGGDDMESVIMYMSSNTKDNKEENNLEIDDTLYFQLNLDMINIMIRNKLIQQLFFKYENPGLAFTLKCIFSEIEPKMDGFNREESPPFNANEVQDHMLEAEHLKGFISLNKVNANRTISKLLLTNEFIKILMDHPYNIMTKGAAGTSSYVIDYTQGGQAIKKFYLEQLIKQKFGPSTWRIIHCLLERGKMDEKEMCQYVLLPLNHIRSRLSELVKYDFVQMQEVPKSADRNPSRAIYLWYCNLNTVYSTLVAITEKTTVGLLEARNHLTRINSMLIAKSERTDIAKDLTQLPEYEQTQLANLNSSLGSIDIMIKHTMDYMMIFKNF